MKACSLDTLARDPEQPVAAECFLTFEAKALRECREALSGPGGVGDAYSYAEANPHPRLWRLVGEAALEKLGFVVIDWPEVSRARDVFLAKMPGFSGFRQESGEYWEVERGYKNELIAEARAIAGGDRQAF